MFRPICFTLIYFLNCIFCPSRITLKLVVIMTTKSLAKFILKLEEDAGQLIPGAVMWPIWAIKRYSSQPRPRIYASTTMGLAGTSSVFLLLSVLVCRGKMQPNMWWALTPVRCNPAARPRSTQRVNKCFVFFLTQLTAKRNHFVHAVDLALCWQQKVLG